MNFSQMDLILNPTNKQDFEKEKRINWKADCLGELSDQTFENFLVSPSNFSVVKIIKTICQNPGVDFPLVYIVGNSGIGKTHLIHAAFKELSKSSSVFFSSGRDFLEYYQERCEKNGHARTLRDFNNSYNVLMLDDIDEVYQSREFQSYFCHLYNHFSYGKKQIILSGFSNQKNLAETSPKFFSRLNAALVLEINPMDNQLATSYLEMVSNNQKIHLDFETKKEMLGKHPNDGRSLKGALVNLKASSMVTGEVFIPPPIKLSPEDQVIKNISADFNLDEGEVLSPSRKKELILPRHLCMFFMYKVLGICFFQVGKKFNRDHSSVIYAVTKIEDKMKGDKDFSDLINKMTDSIRKNDYFSLKGSKILYH